MKVYEVEKDGYPEDWQPGTLAFIFDGCIVSGWPLENGNWTADSDVGRHGEFHKDAVKKYVIFDKPVWEM